MGELAIPSVSQACHTSVWCHSARKIQAKMPVSCDFSFIIMQRFQYYTGINLKSFAISRLHNLRWFWVALCFVYQVSPLCSQYILFFLTISGPSTAVVGTWGKGVPTEILRLWKLPKRQFWLCLGEAIAFWENNVGVFWAGHHTSWAVLVQTWQLWIINMIIIIAYYIPSPNPKIYGRPRYEVIDEVIDYDEIMIKLLWTLLQNV